MTLRPYTVTIHRTEAISFRLLAASRQDAEERYLTDGDETDSDTVGTDVQAVEAEEPDD